MKMLDGSLQFREHTTKSTQNTPKAEQEPTQSLDTWRNILRIGPQILKNTPSPAEGYML